MEDVTPIGPPADAAEVIAAASAPRVAYDDARHPELRVSLTYRGIRLAEDHPDFAERIQRDGAGGASLRFRCPPSELPYYAREIVKLGTDATVHGPPELVEIVRTLARDVAKHHDDASQR